MGAQLLSRFLSGILLFSIVGCAGIQEIEEPVTTTAPLVDQLRNLPPPEKRVTIAVYKFNDLTGQRKPVTPWHR